MTKFVIEDSFWDIFPDAALGVVVAKGIKPVGEVSEGEAQEISALLKAANESANQYLTSNVISENAPVKVWRDAYSKFKTKKGARCSIENLLKRVLKGNPVGSINPVVDIYNAISLKYVVPMGGEDIDSFEGDLRLDVTNGGDAFCGLGEEKDEPTLEGEVCYRDDAGAVCRCFNWRDAQRTALHDDTANAFLVIECVDPDYLEATQAAIDELAELMERYMGATITAKTMVTRETPELALQ